MKKLTVLMLVATLIVGMFAVSASANNICESYGEIPKVDKPITLDGLRDGVYDYGVKMEINSGFHGEPNESGVSGTMWAAYDDNNLYVFIEVRDSSVFDISKDPNVKFCPTCGKQQVVDSGCAHMTDPAEAKYNIWNDDCVEFMVDWTNNGSVPSQYRVNRSGIATRDWDTQNIGFTAAASAGSNGTWYGELSIPLDSSKQGTEIGLMCMINNQKNIDPYEADYILLDNSAGYSDPWGSEFFDYITLGAPVEVPDDATGVVDGGNNGGNNGGGTTTPTGPAPTDDQGNTLPTTGTDATGSNNNPNKPAQTADPIAMVVVAAMAALGAAVVIKKTCFSK